MASALENIFKDLNIEEKGVKASFSIEGEDFWIMKSRGLFRLQTIARALLDACENHKFEVISGSYDYLIKPLMDVAGYAPKEGDGIMLSGEGYDEVMKTLSIADPLKAMNIHQDIPFGLAVACLGKPILSAMMPELVGSTSENLADSSQENSETTEPVAESEKTLVKPVQTFRVGAE